MSTYLGIALMAFAVIGIFLSRRLTGQFAHIIVRWGIDESGIDPKRFRWEHWVKLRPIYCRRFLLTYLCMVYSVLLFISGTLLVGLPKDKRDGLFFAVTFFALIGVLYTHVIAGIRRRELKRLDRIYRLRNLGFTPAAPRPSSDD